MDMQGQSAADLFEKVLSRWWLLALLTVLGGLGGWVVSFGRTPIYEARTSIEVIITDARLGENRIERLMKNAISIVSPRSMSPALIQDIEEDCPGSSTADMQLEHRLLVLDLVVHCSNPQGAADLANAWAEAAGAALTEAYDHSLVLEELTLHLEALKDCLHNPSKAPCSDYTDLEALRQEIQSLEEDISIERAASQGMRPEFSFRIESRADVPSKPEADGRGVLILAGVVIGVSIGLLVVSSSPGGLARRKR